MARATYYAWRARRQRPASWTPKRGGGRPRRGYVWTANDTKVAEGQVLEWLSEFIIAGDGQAYGYRKLTTWLRREHGLIINKKTVYRLLRSADLLQGQPLRPSGNRPPRVLAANRMVTGPNQLWEMDLKYGYIAGEDRFFYLCSVIDVFDRCILAYHLGSHCIAVQALGALEGAVRARQADWGNHVPVIRTDNGPQFVAQRWAIGCQVLGITHERIPVATPNKNAHIESWHSLLEGECWRNQVFQTLAEAYTVTAEWIRFYNERRMHGSLHDWAPAVYYAQCQTGTAPPIHPVRC
ncbi:IS3 family transposase [Sulfobacillus thermosulfidooxidans]|uniref:IS3 family transposase n=1 Tax=Sulfobacillus thermosulfidooxidans TaxID=28034 RepID=UPI001FA8E1AF|nr:IS3 family transposase [Sulfobacillus thermosulfidooxidans]